MVEWSLTPNFSKFILTAILFWESFHTRILCFKGIQLHHLFVSTITWEFLIKAFLHQLTKKSSLGSSIQYHRASLLDIETDCIRATRRSSSSLHRPSRITPHHSHETLTAYTLFSTVYWSFLSILNNMGKFFHKGFSPIHQSNQNFVFLAFPIFLFISFLGSMPHSSNCSHWLNSSLPCATRF